MEDKQSVTATIYAQKLSLMNLTWCILPTYKCGLSTCDITISTHMKHVLCVYIVYALVLVPVRNWGKVDPVI
jgi:hypothetical protein